MIYPTIQQVLRANQTKLREWYDKLPPAETSEQNDVLVMIYRRLCKA